LAAINGLDDSLAQVKGIGFHSHYFTFNARSHSIA
jgi:hypothetical protein